MEPVLNKFSWKTFFVYSLVFIGFSILFDVGSKTFQQPDFVLNKYLIVLFIKSIPWAFLVALFKGNKKHFN